MWVCVVLVSLLSWADFNSGFLTLAWLYLYEHFHCLMNPGGWETVLKTHLKQLKKTFFKSGRSDHLITNKSQALSGCTPSAVDINHAASCWPARPLWWKFRAAPKTSWVQFVLLTKCKQEEDSVFTFQHSLQMCSCLRVQSAALAQRHADIDSGKAKRGSCRMFEH